MYRYLLFLIFSVTWIDLGAQDTRIWATYYGANDDEKSQSMAVDLAGNIYMVGSTRTLTGIALNAFQPNHGGGMDDIFLVKLNASGTPVWATYYGSTGNEVAEHIAVDKVGNVYICGNTTSTSGFTSGGFQNTYGGGSSGDAFLVKFDAAGNRKWATYYGGAGGDFGNGVAVDLSCNVYLAGNTNSPTNIASGGYKNTLSGSLDSFLAKFDSSGNRIWGTYYGGFGSEEGVCVITDSTGNVMLGGLTTSTTGISSSGFQNTYGGGPADAFLAKFNSSCGLIWGTYYGGSQNESAQSLSVGPGGNIYMGGYTTSTNGIAAGGFQNTKGTGALDDAYLVKFSPSGARLWGTYYGGSNIDIGRGTNTDPSGNVYMVGWTKSTSGMASGGFQNTYGGSSGGSDNGFLVKFGPTGNRICATYYGDESMIFYDVATDVSGNLFATGFTSDTTGIASGGFQNKIGGKLDMVLVKFTSFGTTGFPPEANCSDINIYPNPSSRFFLRTEGNKAGTLSIFDLLGDRILELPLNNNTILDLSDKPAGIYLYQVVSEGQIISRGKLLVK